MLRELGSWKQEVFGKRFAVPIAFSELSDLAKRAGGASKVDTGVASLLGEIMQTNTALQKRLDAREAA